ncbi:hypothetical protein DFJ63DRAFT_314982 [Scheffersomyces coipomensis]|uniref:uncharacterized protein n=1 Tax=Scheffersomyces coipomensis TaxID=1788519 RepID=UPI00315D9AE6
MRFSDRVLMVYEMGTSPVNLMTLVQNFKRIRLAGNYDRIVITFFLYLFVLFYGITGIKDDFGSFVFFLFAPLLVVLTLAYGGAVHELWNNPIKDVSFGLICVSFCIHILFACYGLVIATSNPLKLSPEASLLFRELS